MIKKILMVFLFAAFVFGTGSLFLFLKRNPQNSISLPKVAETPTPALIQPTPTVTFSSDLTGLENDFIQIQDDLKKLSAEDIRFALAEFIFDLGLE